MDYDPFSPALLADPYPAYRRLRDEAPVHWQPEREVWLVSRFDDAQAALRDWRTFSSAQGIEIDDDGRVLGGPGHFLSLDPSGHTLLRRVVHDMFRPATIAATMEAPIRARCAELLSELVGRPRADLATSLCWPLPIAVAAQLVGLPRGDEPHLASLALTMAERELGTTAVPAAAQRARTEIRAHFADVLTHRRRRPGDDRISLIVQARVDGQPLSSDAALDICLLLFLASIETTAGLLAGALHLLSGHPDQRQALARDRAGLPRAVEEVMRFESPVQVFARTATRPAVLRDRAVAAGQRVFVLFGSANRDERRFERADEFDVGREPRRHLGFGEGIHHCLGAPLARLEARIAIEQVLERFPHYEVDGPVRWLPNHSTRALVQLPVALNAD